MNIAFGPVRPLAPATSREFLVSGFSFLVLAQPEHTFRSPGGNCLAKVCGSR